MPLEPLRADERRTEVHFRETHSEVSTVYVVVGVLAVGVDEGTGWQRRRSKSLGPRPSAATEILEKSLLNFIGMSDRRLRLYPLPLIILGLALMLQVGCGEPGSDPQVNREEIEAVLRDYLPKLGQAYAQRDMSILEGYAVPKEMARISLRTEELAETGRVYEPEFKEVTVEDISVWNYSNAFVTTLEVWDVRSFTLGTHLQVNESLGQRNRVKYQMKRKEGSWVILYRELDQTFDRADP